LISTIPLAILQIRETFILEVADMKNLWLAIFLVLIIITLSLAGCDALSSPAPRTTSTGGLITQNTGIWVTGTGEVTVTPDIATLQVGVEAQETTVTQAQDEASEAMKKVAAALTDSGVTKGDIQTQYFRIRQRTRWDDETDQEIVVGYRVTNTVTAKIRDIEKVGSIIDAVVKAGGDLIRIDDLGFSVDDPSAYYDEAREKATADAKARAEKLAKQTGVDLGKPIYISESSYMPPIYEGMMYAIAETPIPAPAPIEPSISPGEVKITLTVQVAYSIR
jgi:uncharacterized protein YggE